MICAEDIQTLRLIALAKADYNTIKRLVAARPWEVDEDETDLGFLRIFIPDRTDEYYRLIIGYRDPKHPPYSLLTFFVLPHDSEEEIARLNAAFRSTAEALKQFLGNPSVTGTREPSHRSWRYAYQRWSLPEGEFTLVQDEFDIQEGLDVTLWIQPVGTPVDKTLGISC